MAWGYSVTLGKRPFIRLNSPLQHGQAYLPRNSFTSRPAPRPLSTALTRIPLRYIRMGSQNATFLSWLDTQFGLVAPWSATHQKNRSAVDRDAGARRRLLCV